MVGYSFQGRDGRFAVIPEQRQESSSSGRKEDLSLVAFTQPEKTLSMRPRPISVGGSFDPNTASASI